MSTKNPWDDVLVPYTPDLFDHRAKAYTKQLSAASKGDFKRCHHTHPVLKFVADGASYSITGGSCHSLPKKHYDVKIGLDHGMKRTQQALPWTAGYEVYYPIPDMGVPKNLELFKELIAWLSTQIREGSTIHVGCIGGHGRTGLLFSALVTVMTGEVDSITYVRKHYCNKAVESQNQIDWLHKHFGIKKVSPNKLGYTHKTGYPIPSIKGSKSKNVMKLTCVPKIGCIHGENV